MIHRSFGIWAASGIAILSLYASPAAEPVVDAIQRMDDRERSGWAFVRTVEAGGQTQVARHDPRRADSRHGWTLDHIDGKPPSAKEVKEFHQQVDQTQERMKDGHSPTRVASLVDLDSLTLLSTNQAGHTLYSFAPTLGEMPEDQRDAMTGTLVFNPAEQQLESLSVSNTQPYSPKFAVKIVTFDMRMALEAVDGHVVPAEMSTRFQGKAYLKSIDEEIRIRFTDYEWTKP